MYTNPIPIDQPAREQALDICRSFIVQAPAGSGKTQLLTQRFLRLLAHVKQPEEIIAITFTKKAASQMQDRIISALTQTPEQPNDNEKVTHALAQAVLARDKMCHWQLCQNPNRLQIMTIDAFCMKLVRQTPVLSQLNNRDNISSDIPQLYEHAVSQILSEVDNDAPFAQAITTLLTHLDNRLEVLADLLATLLGRREQWLSLILHIHGLDAQRQALEASLQQVVQHAIEAVNHTMPEAEKPTLLSLYQFASQYHTRLVPIDTWPTTDLTTLPFWQSLTHFLLTTDSKWRACANKAIGFPAPSTAHNTTEKAIYARQKDEMQALLKRLEKHPRLLEALIALKEAPHPAYTDQQWNVIAALLELLPLLAAQLKITFSQTHTVDYSELNLGAIQALTDQDMPTDLSLLLDYQLHHILIDEFQDTSITQFKLLTALTAAWQPNDGKSLFLVGDPMQSIYRFRQANVGLFLKTKREGIGQLPLTYLQLTVNFRSSPAVINWVNNTFGQLFPETEDEHNGAITYAQSHPAKVLQAGDAVQPHLIVKTENADAPCRQTQHVVELIQQAQRQNKQAHIGVLVRARSHLSALLPVLRAKNIAFSAVEIERLDQQPVIQDLLNLTYAMLYPCDKVAWLSVLRAPFCGLSLIELTELMTYHQDAPLLDCLEDPPPHLCDNPRFMRVRNTLLYAWQHRYEKPLHSTICGLWYALGGPLAYQMPRILEQAKTFFNALHQHSLAGRLISRQAFEKKLAELYATPDLNTHINLHIMTLHKAKGLEFDIVILPFLEKTPPASEQQLLRWDDKMGDHIDNILLAPIRKTQDSQNDSIYRYLQHQERIRHHYETIRLLYVGATRAKDVLHLVGSVKYNEEKQSITKPRQGSLLHGLYDHINKNHLIYQEPTLTPGATLDVTRHRLSRLPAQWQAPIPFSPNTLDNQADNQPKPQPIFEIAIGTVIHRCLESIAREGLAQWTPEHIKRQHVLWRQQLHALCLPINECDQAIHIIDQAILHTLADPKGRWILSAHKDCAHELALSGIQGDKIQHWVIDRTFIDEHNRCWIIDYKSSQPDLSQDNLDYWLASQKQRYAEKLQYYANTLASVKRHECIHIGLYFPRFAGWIAWETI